jgi:predicted transcriptional regulator
MRPITAADLMNPEVLTVRDDATVAELARFLVDNEITGAPASAYFLSNS